MSSTPVHIPLSQGKVALVDPEDFPRVSQFHWCYQKARRTEYAFRCVNRDGKKTREYLHRFLLSPEPHEWVDHKDGDGLNCTRQNLRLTDRKGNARNAPKPESGFTASYKGVAHHKNRENWTAAIQVEGKEIHLGTYATEEEAALAYDAGARLYQGEFARLNFPEREPISLEEIQKRRVPKRKSPVKTPRKQHSAFRGVSWNGRRWFAQIVAPGVKEYLGTFETEEDAARAYDAAALRLKGAGCFLNFPEG